MKTKKGFTIIEILAAVILLGLIAAIAIPVYNSVSESAKNKSYENKKQQIEIAAVKWASENNLNASREISVNFLLEEGYIKADKEGKYVINPKDDSEMNCYTVSISVTTEINAEMRESKECVLVQQEQTDKDLVINAYKYDLVNNKIYDTKDYLIGTNDSNINDFDWVNTAILLVVTSEKYSDFSSVLFSTEGQTESKNVNSDRTNLLITDDLKGMPINSKDYANVKVIDASVFLNTEYTVGLSTSNGTKSRVIDIKIDKENAITNVKINNEWSATTKKVTVEGSDGNGSGLHGFYIGKEPTLNKEKTTYYETTFKKDLDLDSEDTYYIWPVDNVGNIPNDYTSSFLVNQIDKENPIIEIVKRDFIKLTGFTYHKTGSITVKVDDLDSGIANTKYCITSSSECTPDQNLTLDINKKAIIDFPSSKVANKICVEATDQVGHKTKYCDTITYLVDKTNPVSASASYVTSSIGDVNVTAKDSESDINKVICRYGINGTRTNSVTATKSGDNYKCIIPNVLSKTEYSLSAEVTNNSGLVTNSPVIKFTPQITPAKAHKAECGNDTFCTQGVRVKYGNYYFTMFKKNSDSAGTTYWAITDNVYSTNARLINTFCCDQGHCTYSNANMGVSQDYRLEGQTTISFSDSINSFYNNLPSSRSTKLKQVVQYTGYVNPSWGNYTTDRSWKSAVGMLNYTDWLSIKDYSYAHATNNSAYALSTVFKLDGHDASNNDHYTQTEDIRAIVVNGENKTVIHAINPANTRPLIVINADIVFDGGNGTTSSPYIMN